MSLNEPGSPCEDGTQVFSLSADPGSPQEAGARLGTRIGNTFSVLRDLCVQECECRIRKEAQERANDICQLDAKIQELRQACHNREIAFSKETNERGNDLVQLETSMRESVDARSKEMTARFEERLQYFRERNDDQNSELNKLCADLFRRVETLEQNQREFLRHRQELTNELGSKLTRQHVDDILQNAVRNDFATFHQALEGHRERFHEFEKEVTLAISRCAGDNRRNLDEVRSLKNSGLSGIISDWQLQFDELSTRFEEQISRMQETCSVVARRSITEAGKREEAEEALRGLMRPVWQVLDFASKGPGGRSPNQFSADRSRSESPIHAVGDQFRVPSAARGANVYSEHSPTRSVNTTVRRATSVTSSPANLPAQSRNGLEGRKSPADTRSCGRRQFPNEGDSRNVAQFQHVGADVAARSCERSGDNLPFEWKDRLLNSTARELELVRRHSSGSHHVDSEGSLNRVLSDSSRLTNAIMRVKSSDKSSRISGVLTVPTDVKPIPSEPTSRFTDVPNDGVSSLLGPRLRLQ